MGIKIEHKAMIKVTVKCDNPECGKTEIVEGKRAASTPGSPDVDLDKERPNWFQFSFDCNMRHDGGSIGSSLENVLAYACCKECVESVVKKVYGGWAIECIDEHKRYLKKVRGLLGYKEGK